MSLAPAALTPASTDADRDESRRSNIDRRPSAVRSRLPAPVCGRLSSWAVADGLRTAWFAFTSAASRVERWAVEAAWEPCDAASAVEGTAYAVPAATAAARRPPAIF